MIIELRVSWSPLSTNLTATIPSALGVVSNDVVGPACFGGVGVRCCRLGDHVARSSRAAELSVLVNPWTTRLKTCRRLLVPSTPNCSGPGFCCSNEPTPSTPTNRPASTGSSTPSRGSKPDGTHSNNSTASYLYLANDRAGRPASPGPVHRPLRHRQTARVPQRRRYDHRLG